MTKKTITTIADIIMFTDAKPKSKGVLPPNTEEVLTNPPEFFVHAPSEMAVCDCNGLLFFVTSVGYKCSYCGQEYHH